MRLLTVTEILVLLASFAIVRAFVPSHRTTRQQSSSSLSSPFKLRHTVLHMADASTANAQVQQADESVADRSTLTLLEHVNLNVPNHDYILPFYVELLGCGLDPRKAENLLRGEKTVWANCGASQFHLPYGETAQVIPGHIGLCYDSLEPLKERVRQVLANSVDKKCFQSCQVEEDHVKLVDSYGNEFVCREGGSLVTSQWKQPLVHKEDTDKFQHLATQYGCETTECRGISYVEFQCPPGTAETIALFYDSALDATTSVTTHQGQKVAIVAFGDVDEHGRAAQSLLFRETSDVAIPKYDGHHVAMYVGTSAADFEQAFKNCEMAGVVWVNPRFSDKAQTLQGAKQWNQFRFKDIVDIKTGKKVFELEHEIRSVEHSAWPGKRGN